MFKTRSTKLERIDTGDYTPEEYERFLREIAFINRYFGDRRALEKTLFIDIAREWQTNRQKPALQKPARSKGIPQNAIESERAFSVLDVGCGSGELLRYIAEFARRNGKQAKIIGIDLNEISTSVTATKSSQFYEISAVRGDAFKLPFADNTFDYAISSLFFHHLTDEQIPQALNEMSRVASRGIYVIDLHRHPMAYVLYKVFCVVFRISPLVRHDGSLSILRGFRPGEINTLLKSRDLRVIKINRITPFRIVFNGLM